MMPQFGQPEMLWLLLLIVPGLSAFLFFAWRKKQKLITQFVQSRLLSNLTVGVSQTRQKLRLVLLASAVFLGVLALARPQWGFEWEEAKQQGLDIIVAIDTSKSMLAEDVKPNRLTRAKYAAFDLMKLAKSDRLGLIAFAGSAFLQCPLTLDEEAFRQSVEVLDVNIIPQGGTAIAECIDTAREAFQKSGDNHKVLILFTDGEDHDNGAEAAAAKAAQAGMKIFTIGIGSADGELISIRDEQGNQTFVKDESGNVVKSRLNETLLQKIATATGGFYLPLRGANPMQALYEKGLAPLPKGESTSKLVRNYRERFAWPLTLAILALVAEMFLPHRRRIRRSESIVKAENTALKNAVALVALLLLPLMSHASPSSAIKKYDSGKFDAALDDYQKTLQKDTNDYRLFFNAGDAAYRAEKYDEAKKYFDTAIVASDLNVQQKAYYNLGNTMYQLGTPMTEPDKKQEAWEQSVHNYENALKLNPKDPDAKGNLEFVKKQLEELKKQQQQQQKQQSRNDKSKQDQKQQDQNQNQDQQNKDDQKQAKNQNQENKDQQKQDQQKQDSAKQDQDQQKKDAQKQQQQQQAKNEKGDKQEQKEKQAGQQGEENKDQQPSGEGEMAKAVQMTPEQAKQFLEAMKQDDQSLIFKPPPKENQRPVTKDW